MLVHLIGNKVFSFSELHVHHIDFDVTNNNLSNLKTLCRWCHAKLHTTLKSFRRAETDAAGRVRRRAGQVEREDASVRLVVEVAAT